MHKFQWYQIREFLSELTDRNSRHHTTYRMVLYEAVCIVTPVSKRCVSGVSVCAWSIQHVKRWYKYNYEDWWISVNWTSCFICCWWFIRICVGYPYLTVPYWGIGSSSVMISVRIENLYPYVVIVFHCQSINCCL